MKMYICLMDWAGDLEDILTTQRARAQEFEDARKHAEETFKGVEGVPQIFVKESI